MSEIRHDMEAALQQLRPLTKTYPHPETPLKTSVQLSDVRLASDPGPTRTGNYSYPGLSGYSPVGVFNKVLRRTLSKANERQTEGVSATTRALVVYLMGTKIAEDLAHPTHNQEAAAALQSVEPREYGLDLIAFVVRSLPEGLAAPLMVVDDTTLTLTDARAMFG